MNWKNSALRIQTTKLKILAALCLLWQTNMAAFARELTNDLGIVQQDDATMQWYMDAKFGMFLHWGLYAVPAKGEWFMENKHMSPDEYAKFATDRPMAKYRLDAQDAGVVLKYGDGPNQCDYLGARNIWVWQSGGTYFMHYDVAGTNGWLACLSKSKNLTNWIKLGSVLQLGKTNEDDSASASYGATFFDGTNWQMFYLGTRHTSPAPNLVPVTPYVTMKAIANSPSGP